MNQYQLLVKLDSLTDSEVQKVLDYVDAVESPRPSRTMTVIGENEVLAVLAGTAAKIAVPDKLSR